MAMLDRVDMDVIDVPPQVVLVNDQMLPKSPLPQSPLALAPP
jgi:hypothetical protein